MMRSCLPCRLLSILWTCCFLMLLLSAPSWAQGIMQLQNRDFEEGPRGEDVRPDYWTSCEGTPDVLPAGLYGINLQPHSGTKYVALWAQESVSRSKESFFQELPRPMKAGGLYRLTAWVAYAPYGIGPQNGSYLKVYGFNKGCRQERELLWQTGRPVRNRDNWQSLLISFIPKKDYRNLLFETNKSGFLLLDDLSEIEEYLSDNRPADNADTEHPNVGVNINSDQDIYRDQQKQFIYTLRVSQAGHQTAQNVVLTDILPDNLTFLQANASHGSFHYDPQDNRFIWTIDEMKQGQIETVTLLVSAKGLGTIRNTATVRTDSFDTDLSNNLSTDVRLLFFPPILLSPNGDGINDLFQITGVQEYENELRVSNRYGREVYRRHNYNNDWNGGALPSAVYYYVIKLRSNKGHWERFAGYVTLVR